MQFFKYIHEEHGMPFIHYSTTPNLTSIDVNIDWYYDPIAEDEFPIVETCPIISCEEITLAEYAKATGVTQEQLDYLGL
jgi:hypothetical protein